MLSGVEEEGEEMKNVTVTDSQLPIKWWLEDVDEKVMKQASHLASLPFAFRHIAIMPDAHLGYGMPIGGVMATENVIIPNAVGVDIGCGMRAVKTSLTDISIEQLKKVLGGSKEYKGGIRSAIPVGFGKHGKKQDTQFMPQYYAIENAERDYPTVEKNYDNALKSVGTLGGGNHFIEIQKGDDGHIWVMIHSGSRNLGKQIADYHNKIAKKLNARWQSKVPLNWDLAFLPTDSDEGQMYIAEMNYAVDFAKANRFLMWVRIQEILEWHIGARALEEYDVPHNYAALENHFGRNVWVHRKGATRAFPGKIGIIPGSQGTASYIVEGMGNPESFRSCSHGAGRKMGRKQAKRELNLENEQAFLNGQGILHSVRGVNNLDEASGAYKNIHEVMANQMDLVEIKVELEPLAGVKG